MTSTLLDQAYNTIERKLLAIKLTSQCSTPCGINGIFAALRGQLGVQRLAISARRLAASTVSVTLPCLVLSHAANLGCSTPCGINGIITRARGHASRCLAACSTPFGITEGITPLGKDRSVPKNCGSWCSTPFGIKGITNRARGAKTSPRHGAQRLSASPKESRAVERELNSRDVSPVLNAFRHHWITTRRSCTLCRASTKCSTPFGINGISTRWRRCARGADVLNAFRHQRNHHLPVPSIHAPLNCAQRLSASMESPARYAAETHITPVGAQRLSASTKSHSGTADIHHAANVLNAFRHQRNHTATNARRGRSHVLNAFRHQRNHHDITSHHPRKQVLNAFRHQRNQHHVRRTPGVPDDRAQRLSASTESHPRHPADHGDTPVLNAFRHQRNHHPRRTGSRQLPGAQRLSASLKSSPLCTADASATRVSAQRLSASLESSRAALDGARCTCEVLNAFRHHWNLHSWQDACHRRCDGAQRLSASLKSSRSRRRCH